jgi:DNA-binding NarL/FixJ family response regulator
LTIGLIGFDLLTQDCLTVALSGAQLETLIAGFATIRDCNAGPANDVDIIICHIHGNEISQSTMQITRICHAFPTIPIIVLCDADDLHQPKILRCALKLGVRGFVPTQTANLPSTLAAIRLVKAGGTFVPAELLSEVDPENWTGS